MTRYTHHYQMLSPYARGYLHGLAWGGAFTVALYFILKALIRLGVLNF